MGNKVLNFMFLRFLLFFLELFFAELLFFVKTPKRKYFTLRVILSLIFCFGVVFLTSFVCHEIYTATNYNEFSYKVVNPLSHILLFIISLGLFAFCFDISLKELVSAVTFGYGIRNISFCVYSLIFTNLNSELIFIRINQTNPLNGLLYLGTYSVLYITFYFVLVGDLNKKQILSLDTPVLVIFLFAILFNTILGTIAETESTNLTDMIYYNIVLLSEIISLTLLIVLNSYNQKSNELKLQNETSKLMLENQEKQFKFARANAELLHIKSHDLKHQIAALREGGEAAEKVLNELSEVIQNYESVIITENKVLNIILSEKWMYCTKHKIKFSCTVDPSALNDIEPTILYSLIGNILDNCIEAVMKLKNKNKRVISMSIKHEFGLSTIMAKNYFDGEISIKNGFPKSTKEDKNNHGYGVRSMKLIVDKLDGSMAFNIEEDLFILQISIPD